ncbi:hypothetical protein GCM10023188_12870 [Pontibacter saemangeumensis]|uniref:DUF3857 domain-containing protein n=1 Tax=Pontibacter saemangeumensis TaxID=1084525 RepID=A0ABP8LHY3_9BACT
MKSIHRFIYILALFVSLPFPVLAQVSDERTRQDAALQAGGEAEDIENPLYTDGDVLQFRLALDYEALLKDRGDERGYHPATLVYKNAAGEEEAVKLKVMVRGNHRRQTQTCRFPPLLLNFARKTTKGTPFEHVNKVKMVTHCLNEDYIHREFLVYKAYNLLTDKSFRVRLCRVEYEDVKSKRKEETKFAFLIEDDNEMARRNKGRIVPKELALGMEGTEMKSMATLAVFQYMIGNTDWSVPYRHNIKLLSLDSLRAPYPVPYDFDYSGIVAPPYAIPPPELGISSVRQRLYRGYDFPEPVYAEVISTFKAKRAAIYDLYRNFPYLEKSTQRMTLKFLDDFYEIITDPKDFDRQIVRVGQKNQKGYVVVKGLK